jgi:GNAT superfamily N-acetyltransferase
MDLQRIVQETDAAYKQTFARMEQRPWGFLFWNEENPLYYDANHAHLVEPPKAEEAGMIVDEVIAFFAERQLVPRFYLYGHSANQALMDALVRRQFRLESLPVPVMLWSGRYADATPGGDIRIEPVSTENYDDCLLVESIPEFGGRAVREKAFAAEFAHPAFTHYLLRLNGEPVSTACLFRAGEYVRVESVATLPAYRGRGLIGCLLRHVQEEFWKTGAAQLWICPVDERVEAVYRRYGFETVGNIPFLHAFRGGKGILEIR